MFISVIVTCFNLEKYIAKAIESVLNQDFNPLHYEIVIVDDCSTDRSADIIKSYANVRYLCSEQNLGVLMATVLGVENTIGELVFFLDGDDVWEPFKLSAVVERFKADPRLALVTHDLKHINSSGYLLDRKSRPEQVMATIAPSRADAVTRDGILFHGDYVWLGSAYAVHRTLGNLKEFCTFAKELPDPFNTYQDWPMAFWVACQPGVSCGYVNQKLFSYRLHGANHSGDATSVAKAIRNVRRTRNTMRAMSEIAIRFDAEARIHKATDKKLRFYTYIDDLYSSHKWRATMGFLVSLPYLMTGTSSFWKEVVRFVGVQLLGLEHFISFTRLGQSIGAYLNARTKYGRMSVLYISYDGMLEPLGQSQVLAYLKRLAPGRCIHLISFEKIEDWANTTERERIAQEIAVVGIVWHPLRYHKRPSALATAWDIACGIAVGLGLVLRHRLRIVHARSYVPSVMALTIKRLTGVKYLFDMRGFWADERVDGNLWPRTGRLYSVAKGFERRFLLAADHVVSLTNAAVTEMQRFSYLQGRMPPVTIIPTCADLARFKPLPGISKRAGFVLGYVGSAGTWYLFDEVVACFGELLRLRPEARFLIVNRGEHAFIRERLVAADVPAGSVELTSAVHDEVPCQMARMDAGVFFIKPAFSKQASAPTKLAEFLGCGIPCLGNTGVGDMAEVLEGERVGVALKLFDEASLNEGLQQLLLLAQDPATRARCVASAVRHFSLDVGVQRYADIYRKLLIKNKT